LTIQLVPSAAANAVQVQRWLGHYSPTFTLATYVHLLRDDLGRTNPEFSQHLLRER
jgi:hypothetical protein